jgi:hypothetical protein
MDRTRLTSGTWRVRSQGKSRLRADFAQRADLPPDVAGKTG